MLYFYEGKKYSVLVSELKIINLLEKNVIDSKMEFSGLQIILFKLKLVSYI
jgi:hypothetical protein